MRHAESAWNADGIYQGRLESDLSPLGEQQALALGVRLVSRTLAGAYSSPLTRAVRTVELIMRSAGVSQSAPEVSVRPQLAEIDHGEWSGLSGVQVSERWPELAEQWRLVPSQVRMPGGESLAEVRGRALQFLADVRQRHAEGNILVVSHGTVIRVLLAHFLEMRLEQIWSIEAENCGLSIVDDYDVPLIMAVNDTCHLDGVRSSLSAQVR